MDCSTRSRACGSTKRTTQPPPPAPQTFPASAPLLAAAESSAAPAVPPEVDPPVLTAAEEPLPKPVDDVALNGPPPVESYAIPPAPSEGGKEIYGAGAGITSAPKRFQWGVRLTIRGVYDDNILLSHFDRISDWFVAIEPAITIGYGDIVGRTENYIRLDYAPSIFLYVDHSDDDVVQHLIRLESQYHLGHLTLGLAQDVQILHGSHLDTTTLDASAISIAREKRLSVSTGLPPIWRFKVTPSRNSMAMNAWPSCSPMS